MGLLSKLKSVFTDKPAEANASGDDLGDEDGFVPRAKAPERVAKRLVVLILVTELADSVEVEMAGARDDAIAMRKRALDKLVALGMTPRDLESTEEQFAFGLHTGKVDRALASDAMWRAESAAVLAWALSLRDQILPSDRGEDPASLRAMFPKDAAAFTTFCQTAKLRPLAELLAARHEWMTQFFPVEAQAPSETRSRILERLRALRWLTEQEHDELCSTPVH